MAVVTSAWSISSAKDWITSTGWVATDPAYLLNTQLTNFVTGINDSSKINIQATPNTATTKTTTNFTSWFLQCRDGDTSSDYGIMFHGRQGGQGTGYSGSYAGNYYARTTSTANNGYGTYSTVGSNISCEDLTVAGSFMTAYETTGTTPWFVYSWENAAKSSRIVRALLRMDTSGLETGGYYPSTNISKWIYLTSRNDVDPRIHTPIADLVYPPKGIWGSDRAFRAPIPVTTTGNGYFFRLAAQYGEAHYLGNPTSDMLVTNTSTGVWGSTITFGTTTYTCLGSQSNCNLWIKTA